uniref:Uncharacterized protein n=1 Tax=Shewanella decolorationis TaxID=256839 RepID=A0A8A9LCS8_9GAMM
MKKRMCIVVFYPSVFGLKTDNLTEEDWVYNEGEIDLRGQQKWNSLDLGPPNK